jgi:hypothetical protein
MSYIITIILVALGGLAFTDVAPENNDLTTAITTVLEGDN